MPWATCLVTLGGGSSAEAVAKPLRSRAASTGAGALLAELLALNAPLDAPEPIVVRLGVAIKTAVNSFLGYKDQP